MDKRIKLILTDMGARGKILVDGKPISATRVSVNVAAGSLTEVVLTIPAHCCDITYDADFGLDEQNNPRP